MCEIKARLGRACSGRDRDGEEDDDDAELKEEEEEDRELVEKLAGGGETDSWGRGDM